MVNCKEAGRAGSTEPILFALGTAEWAELPKQEAGREISATQEASGQDFTLAMPVGVTRASF